MASEILPRMWEESKVGLIVITTMDKLPENCCDCPCSCHSNGTCQAIKDFRSSDWRPFWCPLKEIQEGEKRGMRTVDGFSPEVSELGF